MRLSATWTFQARSSTTELTEARSSASSSRTLPSASRPAGVERRGRGRRSLRDERGDDHAAVGLVALAVGLDPGALFQPLVDDAALLGAHRVHLDHVVAAQRLLGGAVGAALERLAAALAVAGGVDDDPFALAQAAEGGLVAEQLQGVDRLAAFADQQAVVVLALDGDAIRSSSSSISTSPSRSSSSSTPSTSSRARSAGSSGQSAVSDTGAGYPTAPTRCSRARGASI